MNAAELILVILHYFIYLANIAKASQKATNKNTLILFNVQEELKTYTKEVVRLNQQLSKSNLISGNTLSPQLKQALSNVSSLKKQLSNANAKLGSLQVICEDL